MYQRHEAVRDAAVEPLDVIILFGLHAMEILK